MIIGVSGKIGSGKDTVGKIIQWLIDQYGIVTLAGKPFGENTIQDCIDFIKSGDNLEYPEETSWQIKKFADKLKQIVSLLTGIPVKDLEKQEVKDRILGEEWRRFFFREKINGIRIPASFYGIYTSEKEAYKIGINHLDLATEVLTVRKLLQEIGTDAMRNIIHPNIWVNALFTDYKKPAQIAIEKTGGYTNSNKPLDFPNWIITDMRFPNELKAVKDRDGISIRVNRKRYETIEGENISVTWLPMEGLDYIPHESETALDNAEFDYTIDNNGTIEELVEKVKQILIKEKLIEL